MTNRKIALIIFASIMISRLLLLSIISIINQGDLKILYRTNETKYHNAALSIMHNNWEDLNVIKDVPLYPIILATVFLALGVNLSAAVIINIILFGISAVILFLIARLFLNNRYAVFAVVIYGCYPTLWMISLYPASDPLFLLLYMLSAYFFLLYLRLQSLNLMVLSALALGAATLTKETCLFLPWIILFVGVVLTKRNKSSMIKKMGIFIAVYFLCLFPLMVKNYRHTGNFSISMKMSSFINYMGRQIILEFEENRNGIRIKKNLPSVIVEYCQQRKQFFFGTGTFGLMRNLGYKIPENWGNFHPKTFITWLRTYGNHWVIYQFFSLLFIILIYIFSFLAFVKLANQKKVDIIICIVAVFAYFLTVHFFIFNSRYFIPLIPFLSILSAYYLSEAN